MSCPFGETVGKVPDFLLSRVVQVHVKIRGWDK